MLATFFFVRNLPHTPRQPLPLSIQEAPQQLFSSVSEVTTTAKMAETVTITEPAEEKLFEAEKDLGTPLASQSPEQETFPPRQYRVTILTVVRDRPTWKGTEVLQLKPNSKISVSGFTGDWLKVESRSQPSGPPGYVWKEDAKPE